MSDPKNPTEDPTGPDVPVSPDIEGDTLYEGPTKPKSPDHLGDVLDD